jgi:hypothetical protein
MNAISEKERELGYNSLPQLERRLYGLKVQQEDLFKKMGGTDSNGPQNKQHFERQLIHMRSLQLAAFEALKQANPEDLKRQTLPKTTAEGHFSMKWAVPTEAVNGTSSFLLSLGKVERFFRDSSCDPKAVDEGELEYKLEQLTREKGLLTPHAERIPGILALLEAQTETLESLLAAQRKARSKVIYQISLIKSGKNAPK